MLVEPTKIKGPIGESQAAATDGEVIVNTLFQHWLKLRRARTRLGTVKRVGDILGHSPGLVATVKNSPLF